MHLGASRIGSPENSRICSILIIERIGWGMPVFLLRLMLVTAIAGAITAHSRAAESQSTPGVSDSQIKIGQTIAYSGPASSFATIGRTQAAYYRMVNDAGGVNG